MINDAEAKRPMRLDYRKINPKYDHKGHEEISKKEWKRFVREMNRIGVKIVKDKNGEILGKPWDKNSKEAGFDSKNKTIVLRNNPTKLSVLHESYHAKQWDKLGNKKYNKQSDQAKEEHVFREIMRNKHLFNEKEIDSAKRYIKYMRSAETPEKRKWPHKDWDSEGYE